jgi:ferrous iron transport protein B
VSAAVELVDRPVRVALVGAPNAGKTTLFNTLTGSSARVGNYPGVTVERREGSLRNAQRPVRVLDLPGTYSVVGETPDEQIVEKVLAGRLAGEAELDGIVAVLDATTLRRGLGLLRELLKTGRPVALVLTMIDEVRARGGKIEPTRLSQLLGIPVLGVVGHRGVGLDPLYRLLQEPWRWSQPLALPAADDPAARFAWVDEICRRVGAEELEPDTRTDRIDRVLLHPVAGIAVFGLVMLLLFQSIFSWAVPAMNGIDAGFGELARLSRSVLPGGWLTELWTDGVLAGVGSVLVFLPQIAILFTFIHLLQDVGYMARAAFVVDRVMGWVGLQGRSFVPLLSCYACAVPGIMAARTIQSPRERLATILVAPFMTCSARLPVYTLLIAAFVPHTTLFGVVGVQGLVLLALYLLGAATALGSAALLGSTLLRGKPSVFYMELPPYRWPTARILGRQVWHSARAFLKRAGTIILATSVVLFCLLSVPRAAPDPARTPAEEARANLEASTAARIGHALEPAIAPLGFDWKIGVGLIASLAAREVIVSTLAQTYAVASKDDFVGLRDALRADVNPATGKSQFGLPAALALCVFFVFALQCTSTMAVMARETGSWRWPAAAFAYMLGLAWTASFVTYQVASRLLA